MKKLLRPKIKAQILPCKVRNKTMGKILNPGLVLGGREGGRKEGRKEGYKGPNEVAGEHWKKLEEI